MKIFDVTVPISEDVPIYTGDSGVTIESFAALERGDSANVSRMCFGVHTGTHVDAPNHFIEGTRRVDELELEKMIGPCRVVEVPDDVMLIEPEHLGPLDGVERVVFRTRNSAFWNHPEAGFRTNFTAISAATARLLADAEIKLVGIDYLSIEAFGSWDHPVHLALLEKEIVILEGLDLRGIEPGDYEIACLPLKFIGGTGDGAPARTVLVKR